MPRPMDAASRFDRRSTPLTRALDVLPEEAWGRELTGQGRVVDVIQRVVDDQRTFLLQAGASLPHPAPKVAEGAGLAWRTHAESVARALADDRVGEAPRAGADGPSTVGDVFDATFGPEMERLREQITALHEG